MGPYSQKVWPKNFKKVPKTTGIIKVNLLTTFFLVVKKLTFMIPVVFGNFSKFFGQTFWLYGTTVRAVLVWINQKPLYFHPIRTPFTRLGCIHGSSVLCHCLSLGKKNFYFYNSSWSNNATLIIELMTDYYTYSKLGLRHATVQWQ